MLASRDKALESVQQDRFVVSPFSGDRLSMASVVTGAGAVKPPRPPRPAPGRALPAGVWATTVADAIAAHPQAKATAV